MVALMNDKNVHKRSGKILITTDIATEFGFKDIGGNIQSDIQLVQRTKETTVLIVCTTSCGKHLFKFI